MSEEIKPVVEVDISELFLIAFEEFLMEIEDDN